MKLFELQKVWQMLSNKAHLVIKILAVEKGQGTWPEPKSEHPSKQKNPRKNTVKKAHQQKKSRALSEEIEKETVRVADGFLEKAARSRVRLEKEIERQVLGNEKMAARSSIEFKKETLENVPKGKEKAVTLSAGFGKQALQKVTDLKEKAARSSVKREKEVGRQVFGNE